MGGKVWRTIVLVQVAATSLIKVCSADGSISSSVIPVESTTATNAEAVTQDVNAHPVVLRARVPQENASSSIFAPVGIVNVATLHGQF